MYIERSLCNHAIYSVEVYCSSTRQMTAFHPCMLSAKVSMVVRQDYYRPHKDQSNLKLSFNHQVNKMVVNKRGFPTRSSHQRRNSQFVDSPGNTLTKDMNKF